MTSFSNLFLPKQCRAPLCTNAFKLITSSSPYNGSFICLFTIITLIDILSGHIVGITKSTVTFHLNLIGNWIGIWIGNRIVIWIGNWSGTWSGTWIDNLIGNWIGIWIRNLSGNLIGRRAHVEFVVCFLSFSDLDKHDCLVM